MSKKKVQYVSPEDLHKASLLQLAQLPNEILILHLSSRHLKMDGEKRARAERLFKAIHDEAHHKPPLFKERLSAKTIMNKRSEATSQTPKTKRKRSTAKQQEGARKKMSKGWLPTTMKIEHVSHQQPVEHLTQQQATVNISHSRKTTRSTIVPTCILSQPVVTQQSPSLPVVRTEHPTNPPSNHLFVTATPQQPNMEISLQSSGLSLPALATPQQPNMGISLQSSGLTLPALPNTLQQRIVRGEYIDFTELLPPRATFPVHPHFMQFPYYRNDFPMYPTMNQAPAEIMSFIDWMQAWNNYITVVIAHRPHCALELIGYQKIITSASSQYPHHRWMAYDVQFRRLASVDQTLRWDMHHPETWFRCMGQLYQLPPLQPAPGPVLFQPVVSPRRVSAPCHGSHRRFVPTTTTTSS